MGVFHRANADTALLHAYLMLTSNSGGRSSVVATGFPVPAYVAEAHFDRSTYSLLALTIGSVRSSSSAPRSDSFAVSEYCGRHETDEQHATQSPF